jgi:hypothetical protein
MDKFKHQERTEHVFQFVPGKREKTCGYMAKVSPVTAGTQGNTEELDPSYKVRNYDYEKFFRPGRVFSTLWTDAFASSTNDSENQVSTNVTYVIYGQRVHSKIRRFVVVRQAKDLKSCTCIAVTTYNGQGVKKRGINLNEHGLIYSSGKAPRGAKGIDKEPLRVHLSKDGEELTNPSLVNYGRVYTVECNVKVKDVGDLDSASRKPLRQYFREVIIDPDDFDGDSSQPPPPGTDNTLAGVGGSGLLPPQGYDSGAADFLSSGNNRSSSGSQYGGYQGYDQTLTSQPHGWNPFTPYTSASQGSYTSPGSYGTSQPLSVGYSPATESSAYPQNEQFVTSSSSATGNLAPPANYTDPNVSSTSAMYSAAGTTSHVSQPYGYSVPRSYPQSSSLPTGSYNDQAYQGSHGFVAGATPSVAGRASYTSTYGPVDNRGSVPSSSGRQPTYNEQDDIDLDDTRDSRRGQEGGSSRTTRPSGGKRHRH